MKDAVMQLNDTHTKLLACRRLAMEQNQKLFNEANALIRSAFDLLDRPDLDSEMFDEYLHMRCKAESLMREAIDHLALLNKHFAPLSSISMADAPKIVEVEKEVA